MSGTADEWSRYERWSEAIAEVVYSGDRAGKPVYLDLEEATLRKVCKLAEPNAVSAEKALVGAVLGTVSIRQGPTVMLAAHLRRLDRWHCGDMLAPPPSLGLLALLSLAAEGMHSGGDMRASNFYGRLAELARLTQKQRSWFEAAYRSDYRGEAVSSYLWTSMNLWLERNEGNRGLPTAFPLGTEHVGLPLSQALIRETDRVKLVDFFLTQGLSPGLVLPLGEMADRLDEWLARKPCPASHTLATLWRSQPEAQNAIAEVAAQELQSWDGVLADGVKGSPPAVIDSVRLSVSLRKFPVADVRLSLAFPTRPDLQVDDVVIEGQDGQPFGKLPVTFGSSGWHIVPPDVSLEAAVVLSSEVRLRMDGNSQVLRRRPRRLVPLRWDEMLNSYVECERLQLGQQAVVLCHAEIARKVEDHLVAASRPGFKKADPPGLPAGWVLFTDVQILTAGPAGGLVDLQGLRPIARAEVRVAGGLKLPGNISKWLTARPPEVRVSSTTEASVTAAIECIRPLASPVPLPASRTSENSILIWNVGDACPIDGDYALQVSVGSEVVRSETIRLRSADTPALQVPGTTLVRRLGVPASTFTAAVANSDAGFRVAPAAGKPLIPGPPPGRPDWWDVRRTTSRTGRATLVRFPTGGPKCMVTGAHLMEIPTGLAGTSTVDGVCRYCGLVKRYPTVYGRTKSRAPTEMRAPSMSAVPAVQSEQGIDWAIAFEAVCHVGTGSATALDRITAQTESGSLFGDTFLRSLESLGHLEVQRNPATMLTESWEVNFPTLVETATGDLALTGYRSEGLLVAVDDCLWTDGCELVGAVRSGAPPILKVRGLDLDALNRLAQAMSLVSQQPTTVVLDAARNLASVLPPLGEVEDALPVVTSLGGRSLEAWDPFTARFNSIGDLGRPGAYRLDGHGRRYIYRREDDISRGRALLGDARLVKYMAARYVGSSLVGYDADRHGLYVPLGADLPGMYGRAAVLASCQPPIPDPSQGLLLYRDVPVDLAAHLQHLLMT